MDLHNRFPALSDLSALARRRLPHFVWEYLVSATGYEATHDRNRAALDKVLLSPRILQGEFEPDMHVQMMGRTYPLPFGIAPVGMSGLFWPRAEKLLAQAGAQAKIPYCLSTVASQTPEDLAPHIGDQGWFQLYPPRDPGIRTDILRRIREAGFHTLVLTVDVPVASRRERQVRSGLTTPTRLTPRLALQCARVPRWSLGMLRAGRPRLRLMESYAEHLGTDPKSSTAHVGYLLRTAPDWDYLHWLRDAWNGPLVIKGVLAPDDAVRLREAGVDAIWVSNHAGRQFDGAPAAIDVLPGIRTAVGSDLPLIVDSGVEGGLDILRGIARGADFVMLGQAWHYALAALGNRGAAHLVDILIQDVASNMGQLGVRSLSEVHLRLSA